MRYLFDHKRRLIAVAADLCLAAGAYYIAHLIRFEGEIPSTFLGLLLRTLPLLLLIRGVCFVALGLYRGVWAYASITDLLAILKSVTAGSGVFAALAGSLRCSRVFPRHSCSGLAVGHFPCGWRPAVVAPLADGADDTTGDGEARLVIGAGMRGRWFSENSCTIPG